MIAQGFRDAAKLLRKEGWCKGDFHDLKGRRCALGALNDIFESRAEDIYQACKFFRKALRITRIDKWNDAPERTKAQVLAAFERAAKLLEKS